MTRISCEQKEIRGQYVTVIPRHKPKMRRADDLLKPLTKESVEMGNLETITPRGEKSVPAAGHNAEKLLKDYVQKVAKKELEIKQARSDIKAILADAKNDDFKKRSIREAVKELMMTQEQRDALRENRQATEDYIAICKDLPLFAQANTVAA